MSISLESNQKVFSQGALYQAVRKGLPTLSGKASDGSDALKSTLDAAQPKPSEAFLDDIRLLGALLGQVICAHEGAEFYLFIERLRQAARDTREHQGRIGIDTLHQVMQTELDAQPDDEARRVILHRAVAAFRLFLLLAGIAEEFHQSLKFNTDKQGEHQGITRGVSMAHQARVSNESLQALIEKLSVRLVFTAHPTKILRQTILHHQRDIFYILQAMHAPDLTLFHQQELLSDLTEKIEVLWATQFSRWTKPRPQEEISRILSYLTRTLYTTVPKVHRKLEQAIQYYYQLEEPLCLEKPLMTLGSWVGGDMDGNPFVTPDVFTDALIRQHRAILNLYIEDIDKRLNQLSHALHRVGIDEDLKDSIQIDLEAMRKAGQDTAHYSELLEREPYRLKLTLIQQRLKRTLTHRVPLSSESARPVAFTYSSAAELLADLEVLAKSLKANGYLRSVEKHIEPLQKSVQVFGFYFASIDLREETNHINLTARAILAASGLGNPKKCTEELTTEILSPKSVNTDHWSMAHLPYTQEETGHIQRMLSMLSVARRAKLTIDPNACRYLVLTMTSAPEDILSALLVLKTQGLFYPIYDNTESAYQSELDLVPLFETIPDLQNATHVMKVLFENPAYQAQLKARGNHQLIMVGYSDSNKDGGYFSSNWCIYQAQQSLWVLAQQYGIKLRFFHGRGGNLGRGGGPAQRAIQGLPSETVSYGQDLTEQGEVISRYYNVPETGQARCENLLNAIIQKNVDVTGKQNETEQMPFWTEVAEKLSKEARKKYNSLVHDNPHFLEYFEQVTPREVDLVKIGSRPSHRSQIKSANDLRAIPWVFRWFQSRQIIPGWYGLGSALSAYIKVNPNEHIEQLKAMYQEWPFMESILENSEVILRQTDLSIVHYYCTLAKDQKNTQLILSDIEAEYQLTREMIEAITGRTLLSAPEVASLKQAIEIKEPYLDPLNYIQVQLLSKYRELEKKDPNSPLMEAYHRVIVSSIEGIATGLGTSG